MYFNNVMMIYTTCTAPTEPQIFILETIAGSPRQLQANWSAPATTNGVITNYTLRCMFPMRSFTNVAGNVYFTTVTGNVLLFILDDLIPYTNYTCSVSATTGGGEGPATDMMTAQTDEAGLCYNTYICTVCTCNYCSCMVDYGCSTLHLLLHL